MAEEVQGLLCTRAQPPRLLRQLGRWMAWCHPVRLFAYEESYGRDAGRNNAALPFSAVFERRWMRRQTSPAHCPGQAQTVQHCRIVAPHSPPKDLAFPRICGHLKPLQLPEYIQRAALAQYLRSRSDMLPAQQPSHELRRGHRLNLFAQSSDCKSVNACQQSPIAPFDLILRRGLVVSRGYYCPRSPISKCASQDGSCSLHSQEGLIDL